MTPEPKPWEIPFTPEERAALVRHCMFWPETTEHLERLRYDATLTQAEARIAELEAEAVVRRDQIRRLTLDAGQATASKDYAISEIARLTAVACEWKPFEVEPGIEADCVADVDVPGPFILFERHATNGRIGVEARGLDRENSGRVAATLAHFARTGELPR